MKVLGVLLGTAAMAGMALGADGISGSGLVVLDPSAAGALTMTGNSLVHIPAKAVYVNSSSNSAVKTTGSATLDAPKLFVVGGTAFNGSSVCTGTVHAGVVPSGDPMAWMSFPSAEGVATFGAQAITGGAVTLQPGNYAGGISITGNAQVQLAPGTYFVGGSGLKMTAGAISGANVTIVMQAGELDVAGTAAFALSPPSTGGLAGVVIAQPSSNTSEMHLAGGSGFLISGTIYAPAAHVELVGNGAIEGEGPQMGDLVVAGRVTLKGTGTIKIGGESKPAILPPKLPYYD